MQRTSLAWIMNREVEDELNVERIRIESFALAANQATSPEFIKALFADRVTAEEEVEDASTEWETYETPEDLERFLNGL